MQQITSLNIYDNFKTLFEKIADEEVPEDSLIYSVNLHGYEIRLEFNDGKFIVLSEKDNTIQSMTIGKSNLISKESLNCYLRGIYKRFTDLETTVYDSRQLTTKPDLFYTVDKNYREFCNRIEWFEYKRGEILCEILIRGEKVYLEVDKDSYDLIVRVESKDNLYRVSKDSLYKIESENNLKLFLDYASNQISIKRGFCRLSSF